jgi:hypothetical protein
MTRKWPFYRAIYAIGLALTAAASSLLLIRQLRMAVVAPLPTIANDPFDETRLHNMNYSHRRLQENQRDQSAHNIQAEIHSKTIEGPSIIVNMLRRARERVSDNDVPFLLEVPHTPSDTMLKHNLHPCPSLWGVYL